MQHTNATQWILALRLLKQWLQNALQDFVLRLAPSIVKSKAKAAAQRLSKATHACSCGVLLLSHFHAFAVLQHSHVSMHVTFARVKVACEVDLNRLRGGRER